VKERDCVLVERIRELLLLLRGKGIENEGLEERKSGLGRMRKWWHSITMTFSFVFKRAVYVSSIIL